jgi:hypothetical protein
MTRSEFHGAVGYAVLIAGTAEEGAENELDGARRYHFRFRVTGADANSRFATPHHERRSEVHEAPLSVLAWGGEIAHPRGRIATIFCALIAVIAQDGREGALSVPCARVIGALVVVLTDDAVAQVGCTAEATLACPRDTRERAPVSIVRRFRLAVRTALSGIENVDVVHTAIECAGVAVVAIEPCPFTWALEI